jgi:hypothetical protein
MNELPSVGSGNRVSSPVRGSAVTTVLIGVILVGALYFGREVFVPIALAILMSFVLAPLVALLQRLYVPRIAAVLLVVLFAFTAVFALGGLMVSQVNQLASDSGAPHRAECKRKMPTITAAGWRALWRSRYDRHRDQAGTP